MRYSFFIFVLCISFPAWSYEPSSEEIAQLAAYPTWRKLLHFEGDSSEQRSAIHSPEFFLAETGNVDPDAELTASIREFNVVGDLLPNSHALCRFPARALWIKQHRPTWISAISANCPDYQKWNRDNSVESVSVVFASGYLGNPASYYGHTLLKLNFPETDVSSYLLDSSVNYGAIVPKGESSLAYIYRGVTGGYEGGFSNVQFYFHDHNYGDNELRDLWEYRLDLSEDETKLVAAHAWEVLGKKYTYYFFRLNCTYRMAELLEIVDGLHVQLENRPWTVPQAYVQQLAASTLRGKPLVRAVRYLPSRQSRFYARYSALPPDAQRIADRIVERSATFADDQFAAQPSEVRNAIIDTTMDYYQYVGNPWPTADKDIRVAYAEALAQRFKEPAGRASLRVIQPEAPDKGRPPSYTSAGYVKTANGADYVSIRLRPAYYDSLDASAGHVANAALSMGDLWLGASSERLFVQRLDAISIESVSPAVSFLPGDRGAAWGLRAGLDQRRTGCQNCLVAKISGYWGSGKALGDSFYGSIVLGGAATSATSMDGIGYLMLKYSAIASLAPRWRTAFSLEQRSPISANQAPYSVGTTEIRYELTAKQDMRIQHVRDRGTEWRVTLGYYW